MQKKRCKIVAKPDVGNMTGFICVGKFHCFCSVVVIIVLSV